MLAVLTTNQPKILREIVELEWESGFETGNEYVDLQHRYFLNLINRVGINFRETNDVAYQ